MFLIVIFTFKNKRTPFYIKRKNIIILNVENTFIVHDKFAPTPL